MLLACDVGNTDIVFGVFKKNELLTSFRIATEPNKTSDEYGVLVKTMLEEDGVYLKDIEDCIISSVVPEVMHSLENFSQKFLKKGPYIVGQGLKTGINIKYQNPAQVGADRIVNAVAAHYKYKCPLIIIDFGTATTFCSVTRNGDYMGGAIAPGIKISSEALFIRTSKLPKIEIVKPESPIGKNTIWAMQAGIYYGYAGLVDNIVERMYEEMGEKDTKIIATGGLSGLIMEEAKTKYIIDRTLTLDGLYLIYEKNKEDNEN